MLRFLSVVLSLVLLASVVWAAENIAPNGDFEQGAANAPVHWIPAPATEVGTSLLWTKTGRGDSAAIVVKGSPSPRPPQWTATISQVQPGQHYEAGVWMRVDAPSSLAPQSLPQFKVIQLNAAGQLIARPGPGGVTVYSQSILSAKPAVSDWQELTTRFIADDEARTLLLVCVGGRGFQGVAHFDDLRIVPLADERPVNDYYHQVDTSVPTPHVPWARPLAGGKLKVFCLINNPGKRELVELWQRLDLDFEAVVAASPSALGYAARHSRWRGNTDAEKLAELRAKLAGEYDVYLIANVAWDVLPAELRSQLLERVGQGKGLVVVFRQPSPPADLQALRSQTDLAGQQWILSGLPLARMRTGAIETHLGYHTPGPPLRDLVKACTNQTGRAVFLEYPFPAGERYRDFAGREGIYHGAALCPFLPFDPEQTHEYEYHLQLMARSILWAAQRAPSTTLALEQPSRPAGPAPVVVRLDHAPAGPLRLWYRLVTAKGQVLAQGNQPVAGATVALDLGFVPATDAQLELRLLDEQERVHAFATAPLTITGPARITDIQVERAKVNDGQLQGAVLLDAVGPGELRLQLVDVYDRRVLDEKLAIKEARVPFAFALPRTATARFYELRAEWLDGTGRAVSTDKTTIAVPQPERQDVTYLAWASAYFGAMPMTIVNRFCKERWGMDLYDYEILHAAKVAGPRRFAGAIHPGTTASLAFDQLTVPWNIQVTYQGTGLERKPCLDDPAYRNSVRDLLQTAVRYYRESGVRPPFYSLGDEFNLAYPGNPDVCFAEHTRKRFRSWLEQKYGSLDKLNQVWGTRFGAWDEVGPIILEDARKENQPARWLDHRLHMDDVVLDFIGMCRRAIHELDPGAPVGFESIFRSYSECGYDLERISERCEYLQSYEYPYRWEMLASFMPPGGRYGLWSNSHTTREAARYQVWKSVAHGLNTFGWWRITGEGGILGFDLGPGGVPTKRPGLETQAAAVAAARRGPARLLFDAPRIDQSVAILHSQTSLHMGKFDTGDASVVSAAWSAWGYILEDLGIGYRYLKSSAIDQVTPQNTKVVILPFAVSLPDNVVAALTRYVEAGGTVISDVRAGARDGAGQSVAAGPLAELLGITHAPAAALAPHASPLGKLQLETGLTIANTATRTGQADDIPYGIVHPRGRGRAITLNFLPAAYVPNFAPGDFAIMQYKPEFAINPAVADLVRDLLAPAGVGPAVGIGAPGRNVPGFEQFVRAKGATRLVTIVRKFFGETYTRQSAVQTVHLGAPAHVYEVRSRQYLGWVDQVPITLALGETAVLNLLPYQPRFTGAQARHTNDTIQVTGRLETGPATDIHHVLHVQVTDPTGRVRVEEERNVTLDQPAFHLEFPLPLNAPAGTWTISLVDVGSDQQVNVSVARAP